MVNFGQNKEWLALGKTKYSLAVLTPCNYVLTLSFWIFSIFYYLAVCSVTTRKKILKQPFLKVASLDYLLDYLQLFCCVSYVFAEVHKVPCLEDIEDEGVFTTCHL